MKNIDLQSFEERMGGRFDRLDQRFDQVDKKFEVINERFASVDERFCQIDKRFDRVDERFDEQDRKFGGLFEYLDGKFNFLLEGFHAFDAKVDKNHEEFKEFREEANFKFDALAQQSAKLEERTALTIRELAKVKKF